MTQASNNQTAFRKSCATLMLGVAASAGCFGAEDPLARGTGQFSVTPESEDFGEVPITFREERTVAVHNTGDIVLTIGAAVEGGFYIEGEAEATLDVDELRSWAVRFAPLELGAVQGRITFTATDIDDLVHDVTLTGTGVALPACDDGNPCTDDLPGDDGGVHAHRP